MNKKFISWRRVSTFRQSKSGLGLAAQKEIIEYFVKREGGELIADFAEVYTGKDLNGCTELRKAINLAKKTENGVLIIAKTDRFRNTVEALQVYEEVGSDKMFFCDLPHTDKFTLTLFFALAEREALLVSLRTKQALKVKKANGNLLGAANERYRAGYATKSNKVKEEINKKRGATKTANFLATPETKVLINALRRVFDIAEEDITKWTAHDLNKINTKKTNRDKILSYFNDLSSVSNISFKEINLTAKINNLVKSIKNYNYA